MNRKEFSDEIIRRLILDPDGWKFSQYVANYRGLEIWIANRPCADLTIAGLRIGTWWQRRKIRRVMDDLRYNTLLPEVPQISQIDRETAELLRKMYNAAPEAGRHE